MGIGNATGMSVREALFSLAHYPSWGSETPLRPEAFRPPSSYSLPLMGIGNADENHPGDWGGPLSLPLMGIGNPWSSGCRRIPPISHYPSWGSETRGRTPPRQPPLQAHYPSWGSETPVRGESAVTRLPTFSLPLMGIGNRRRGCRSSRRRRRSLPLMGIGNTPMAIGWCLMAIASLPLMGIGNRSESGPHIQPGNLITPHGDRKLGCQLDRNEQPSILITPHGDRKRSWRSCGRQHGGYSLPLMGIGNPNTFCPSTRPPCSLPLMGIGNPYLQKPTRALRSSYAETTLPPCPNAVS